MDGFTKICEDLNLKPSFKAPYIRKGSNFENSSQKKYIRKTYPTEKERFLAMKKCQAVMNDFTITLDGSVVPCCYDFNNFHVFGNIFKQNVLDIWFGESYRKFRKDVKKGKIPEFCKLHCYAYPTHCE
ncbi:hypothetical protein FACS189491_11880 [Spirochaetia bacterium]|nr:hypothetical protein FACS189491_11880 [Spirochaetia bacterium]